MEDPKKDYELLMRYLQDGALKREPVSIPDPKYKNKGTLSAIPSLKSANSSRNDYTILQRLRAKMRGVRVANPTFSLPKKTRLIIAVLAICILSIAIWKGYTFYQLTPERIFTDSYIPYNATVANDTLQEPLTGIHHFYQTGNYVAATMQARKQTYLTDEERLLAGLAYFHRDDYTTAIKWLEPLSNNFKSSYRQQAEYYLTLVYLKNEDYDRCIHKMENIVYTPSHLYNKQFSPETIQHIKVLKWK